MNANYNFVSDQILHLWMPNLHKQTVANHWMPLQAQSPKMKIMYHILSLNISLMDISKA